MITNTGLEKLKKLLIRLQDHTECICCNRDRAMVDDAVKVIDRVIQIRRAANAVEFDDPSEDIIRSREQSDVDRRWPTR